METQLISLKRMVSNFLIALQPLAARQSSFFINEVSEDFMIAVDKKELSSLLHFMLSSVVAHSRNSCIRISAKQYGNVALVKFRDQNEEMIYDMSRSRQQVISLTEKLGACIMSNNNNRKTGALTLSFPNVLNVA